MRAMPSTRQLFLLVATVFNFSVPHGAAAQYIFLEAFATGLSRPVSIVNAGDGSGRLFVVEQGGKIIVHDGTQVLSNPFLDVSSQVSCCGEGGLLDIAFHPKHAENGLFFISYTDNAGNSVIARYAVSNNPNLADSDSGTVVLTVAQPYSNHNGGQIQFGPDGYLYIAMGDGGSGGDPDNRAQDIGELLGKLLRIDVSQGPAYAIPPDNPFVGVGGARDEIWAFGLRNPWRFSFDRLTGDLFIADVGQGSREEVNYQLVNSSGGENYGWRLMEGSLCFAPPTNCNGAGTLILPIVEYGHANGDCSITGGYRYRGNNFPPARGLYFYGDYCSGRIRAAAKQSDGSWISTEVLDTTYRISSFGEDETGEIYLAHHVANDGVVYRLVLHESLAQLVPSSPKDHAMPWLGLLLE